MKEKITVVGTPWFIRLGVYVVVALTGLVLTVVGMVNPDTVNGWLDNTGSLAALIGGLLAAANTGKHSDTPVVIAPSPAPATTPSQPRVPSLEELRASLEE